MTTIALQIATALGGRAASVCFGIVHVNRFGVGTSIDGYPSLAEVTAAALREAKRRNWMFFASKAGEYAR